MKQRENDILALSWPIFIELLLQMLVGNADQIMVGWHDPSGVGAIGNANQVTNLVLLVFSVVCTATMILISQYIGARDAAKVERTYTVALVTNIAFGVLVSLILILGCGGIFRLMGVHREIFDKTCGYMRLIGAGMVFQAVYLTFTAFFRSSQMMKETMIVSLLMNCLNIGGNAVLIGGLGPVPALGVLGAALSSDLSRLIGVATIAVIFRRRFGRAIRLKELRPFPAEQFKRLLALGLPTGGESVSYNLSQICIQTLCNRFAQFVVNTRVYANMFANLTYLFASALSQAAQVVVARLMGGGDVPATRRSVRLALLGSIGVSLVVSILLYLFAGPVYGLFTKDMQVIALARIIMLIEIPLEVGRAVNMTMCRTLQACGDIRYPIVLCVIFAWVVAVGAAGSWGSITAWACRGCGSPWPWTSASGRRCS